MPVLFFEVQTLAGANTQMEVVCLNNVLRISPHPSSGKENVSVIYFAKDHFIQVDEKYDDLKARISSVNPPK